MIGSFTPTKTPAQINPALKYYFIDGELSLESGAALTDVRIAYQTFGQLNADKSNVVWVCHALTANADPTQWWPGLIGENHLINPKDHYIICANILGSCYGTTGPRDFDQKQETVTSRIFLRLPFAIR